MVYGKIIFNNIKEYTPSWIKTIPYSQTTKPLLSRYKHRFTFQKYFYVLEKAHNIKKYFEKKKSKRRRDMLFVEGRGKKQ